jgi:hypothetical protein
MKSFRCVLIFCRARIHSPPIFAAMDVQISRSLLSTYWTLALILTGVVSPLLGKLYSAVGARVMVAVAGKLFSAT